MKVAYVAGVCVNHDAISNAIRDEIGWLAEAGHDARLFAYACDHGALPFVPVKNEVDILTDPFFQRCDIVVFHFGIYYPLFNILPAVRHTAKKIVVFHNITPKAFLPPSAHGLIERSFAQLSNLRFADHVICDSSINQQVMREQGVATPSTVIPLPVHAQLLAPPAKPSFADDTVRMLFVGRFVRSKGPLHVLRAVEALLRNAADLRLAVEMMGNLKFSDDALVTEAEVLAAALQTEFGQRLTVSLVGNASEEHKMRSFMAADIFILPTYHEGFCVPILEAIASGCLVLSYHNSNTPFVSSTLR